MGQKDGEKWTAAGAFRPTFLLSRTLLVLAVGGLGSAWAQAGEFGGMGEAALGQDVAQEPVGAVPGALPAWVEAPEKVAEPPVSQEAPLIGQGLASWYGNKFHGRRTASGERYDKHAFTAAHKTLPFGSLVRVKSVRTGKEVVVRINDRGPYKRTRLIDLSGAAAAALGIQARGVSSVILLRE